MLKYISILVCRCYGFTEINFILNFPGTSIVYDLYSVLLKIGIYEW